MSVTEINHIAVINLIRQTLGLPNSDTLIDDCLIASSVRRAAGFLCPCSVATLQSTIVKTFTHLVDDLDEFKNRIEDIINRLIIGGDLLELNDVSTNDLKARATWVFTAHPSFLNRNNSKIIIFGIVPDENSPLSSLSDRIQYEDCKRFLIQQKGEDLIAILKELGLMPISENSWLKLPKKITSFELVYEMNNRLFNASLSGDIPGLLILDSNQKNTYYRGRWTVPENHTGNFVAKRPFLYGQIIWCYVELSNGKVKRFVDIPFKLNGISQRGCDGGWHLQMAIDFNNDNAQEYYLRSINDAVVMDFYSPLPLWAERRLIAFGKTTEPNGCLFSYLISKADFLTEEKFMQEYLWLKRKQ